AFGQGDIEGILRHVAEDVRWEAEGPAEMVFTGIRNGKDETLGFFKAIAQEHSDPKLEMTDFVSEGDAVAVFGRYQATMRTGRRADTPVAHLFRFRDGKVIRYVNLVNTAEFVRAS